MTHFIMYQYNLGTVFTALQLLQKVYNYLFCVLFVNLFLNVYIYVHVSFTHVRILNFLRKNMQVIYAGLLCYDLMVITVVTDVFKVN